MLSIIPIEGHLDRQVIDWRQGLKQGDRRRSVQQTASNPALNCLRVSNELDILPAQLCGLAMQGPEPEADESPHYSVYVTTRVQSSDRHPLSVHCEKGACYAASANDDEAESIPSFAPKATPKLSQVYRKPRSDVECHGRLIA